MGAIVEWHNEKAPTTCRRRSDACILIIPDAYAREVPCSSSHRMVLDNIPQPYLSADAFRLFDDLHPCSKCSRSAGLRPYPRLGNCNSYYRHERLCISRVRSDVAKAEPSVKPTVNSICERLLQHRHPLRLFGMNSMSYASSHTERIRNPILTLRCYGMRIQRMEHSNRIYIPHLLPH